MCLLGCTSQRCKHSQNGRADAFICVAMSINLHCYSHSYGRCLLHGPLCIAHPEIRHYQEGLHRTMLGMNRWETTDTCPQSLTYKYCKYQYMFITNLVYSHITLSVTLCMVCRVKHQYSNAV